MKYVDCYKKVSYRNKEIKKCINEYNSMLHDDYFKIKKKNLLYINERGEAAAVIDEHYFLMDLYFSKIINAKRPSMHFDIGSRVDGFIAHLLSAGISVTLFDIRPFPIELEGLDYIQTDATTLKEIDDNSLESISSLHAIEHFGLGRYGDNIDPYAWIKALKSIQMKVKPGGFFYLGLPVGNKPELYFNAHRVFTPQLIIDSLDSMKLRTFAYISNNKVYDVDNINIIDEITKNLGTYDCGLFCFEKVG